MNNKMHVMKTPLLALCALALAALPVRSALIFSESFNYPVGSQLAGENGGTGFSGAWTGGDSTIVAGLGGSGNAVQIGTSSSYRALASSFSTTGNSYYFSFLVNSSNFTGGQYTGLSLIDAGSPGNSLMFFGIPWQAKNFGFDARGSTGAGGIQKIDFSPSVDTTYLLTYGLLPSATAGKVDVKLWATSNLSIDPNALVGGTPNAQLLGLRDNFTFNGINVAGNYAGSLKLTGEAAAPTAAEAINFSTQSAAVPEPGTWAAAAMLAGGVAFVRWRKRGTSK